MEIIKAEHLGFCNGVKRAINVAKTHAPCLTYKELIHNKKVVDGLKNEGIYPVHDLSVVQSGDNVVIAAHGAAPSDFEKLARIGANVYDATCPMVKKVQEIVREYSTKGYKIIILGDKNHQEVQGICGFSAETPQIAADFDEISLEDGEKFAVVTQTTFLKKNLKKSRKKYKILFHIPIKQLFFSIQFVILQWQNGKKRSPLRNDATPSS